MKATYIPAEVYPAIAPYVDSCNGVHYESRVQSESGVKVLLTGWEVPLPQAKLKLDGY